MVLGAGSPPLDGNAGGLDGGGLKVLKLLVPTVFRCLDCPTLPEQSLPKPAARVTCPGCGGVLLERLPDDRV